MRKTARVAPGPPVVIPSSRHAPPVSHARAKLVAAKSGDEKKKKRDSSATPDVLAKALRAEFKPRSRQGKNSAVHKAKFLQAQQRIRKELGIQNRVDATTYIALGRVLDGVAKRVIERTGKYLNYNSKFAENHEDGTRKLTERIAITGIRSFFPPGSDPVWDQIHNNMDFALTMFHQSESQPMDVDDNEQ
jgi:hypothetical protein